MFTDDNCSVTLIKNNCLENTISGDSKLKNSNSIMNWLEKKFTKTIKVFITQQYYDEKHQLYYLQTVGIKVKKSGILDF